MMMAGLQKTVAADDNNYDNCKVNFVHCIAIFLLQGRCQEKGTLPLRQIGCKLFRRMIRITVQKCQ